MKRQAFYTLFMALYLSACPAWSRAAEIELYFSPNGGAAAAIARRIDAAQKTILIATYSISESGITASILAAHQRGVDVRLLVDRHQQDPTYSTAAKIKKAGIPTLTDRWEALQHNKVVIIDGRTVVTGSMNLTRSGEKNNAENTLIIDDAAIAARFTENWYEHQKHSTTFSPSTPKRLRRVDSPPTADPSPSPALTKGF